MQRLPLSRDKAAAPAREAYLGLFKLPAEHFREKPAEIFRVNLRLFRGIRLDMQFPLPVARDIALRPRHSAFAKQAGNALFGGAAFPNTAIGFARVSKPFEDIPNSRKPVGVKPPKLRNARFVRGGGKVAPVLPLDRLSAKLGACADSRAPTRH